MKNKNTKIEFVQALGIVMISIILGLAIYWTINVRVNSCRKMVQQGIYKNTYICLVDRSK